ncbi:MAG TPA: sigma-70 family RNA polymerase sigma factor [Phycisphaerae bacterium]|nr:sigma-70 family RNA polymerase sigma factor [Phycisphaerae bacterium]
MVCANSRRNEPEVLWGQYFRTRCAEDRNALIAHYSKLATATARRFARRGSASVSLDELRCAALDGLWRAVEGYDPQRSPSFEAYCQRRMNGAVLDWMRSVDEQSRTVRNFTRRCDRARSRLASRASRAPSDAELATTLGMSAARFGDLSKRARCGQPITFTALDHQRAGVAEGDRRWDIRDKRTPQPDARMARETFAAALTRGLSKQEKLILVLYYYEGLTLAEIGDVLEISESRVCQLHAGAIKRIRETRGAQLRQELCA